MGALNTEICRHLLQQKTTEPSTGGTADATISSGTGGTEDSLFPHSYHEATNRILMERTGLGIWESTGIYESIK